METPPGFGVRLSSAALDRRASASTSNSPTGLVRLALHFFGSLALLVSTARAQTVHKFDFNAGPTAPGFTRVLPATLYTKALGYGFDLGSKPAGDHPFFFSVALPEGNYNVTVTLGTPSEPTTTTLKVESRRLMLESIHTDAGQFTSRTFTVNLRTPQLPSGGHVALKPREAGPPLVADWDDKLTLEFSGSRPSLCALEISEANDAVTLFLAGDSTITDQPREPWNSWGQMLPRFFKPGVAIANHAESGESLPSFRSARRLDKILSAMKPGDYLFIQFGHNDQKDKRPNAGPFTTYKTNLLHFIAETRKHGGIPVLITPVERKAGVATNTLGDFPAAARRVAEQEHIPLIDLHALSKTLYSALGTNLDQAFQDGTHHNNYGSYELARCVVEGIRANKLPIARFLADDAPPFDPNHPDPLETFKVPASPVLAAEKPEGN